MKDKGRAGVLAAKFKAKQELLSGLEGGVHATPDRKNEYLSLWAFEWCASPHSRHLPESIAYQPAHSGVRLVVCKTGYEGQVWDEGIMIASRWWSDIPSEFEWRIFTEAIPSVYTADEATITVPQPVSLPLRKDIPPFVLSLDRATSIVTPGRLFSALCAITIVASGFIGGRLLHASLQLNDFEQATAELSPESKRVFSKRRRATAIAREVLDKDSASVPEDFLYSISAIAGQADAYQPASLRAISVDGVQLEMTLGVTGAVDIPAFVRSLEADPSLSGVSVTVSGDSEIRIRANIDSTRSELLNMGETLKPNLRNGSDL